MIRSGNRGKIACPRAHWLPGVLLGLLLGACGGLAESGSVGSVGGGSPPFQECSATCGDGLECLEGFCSRPCSTDSECTGLSSGAECTVFPSRSSSRACAISCSSDEGCQSLGAGSYCSRVYCVAGNLQALPGSFDAIELRQVGAGPVRGAGACSPTDFETSIKVNTRSGLLMWSRCEWDAASGSYGLNSGSRELDPPTLGAVRSAYAALALSDARECARGADILTLDIEPRDGPELLFADQEHSACPVAQLERSSYVSGLAELYATLGRLDGVID